MNKSFITSLMGLASMPPIPLGSFGSRDYHRTTQSLRDERNRSGWASQRDQLIRAKRRKARRAKKLQRCNH